MLSLHSRTQELLICGRATPDRGWNNIQYQKNRQIRIERVWENEITVHIKKKNVWTLAFRVFEATRETFQLYMNTEIELKTCKRYALLTPEAIVKIKRPLP